MRTAIETPVELASRSRSVTFPVIDVATVDQVTLARFAIDAFFTVSVPLAFVHAIQRKLPSQAMSASGAPVQPPMTGKLATDVTPAGEFAARMTESEPRMYDAVT